MQDIDIFLDRVARPLFLSADFVEGAYSNARVALMGWSIKNLSAAATAELDIYNSGAAQGEIVFPVTLAANESSREWFGPNGVLFDSGLSINVAAGNIDGTLFVVYLDA